MSPRTRPVLAGLSILTAAALALTGCGSGKKVNDTASSAKVSVSKNTSLNSQLPASVRSRGSLTMATDPSYAPIEFTKSGGGFQGFDVDLANALGKTMGVKINIKKAQFDGILSGINAGRYDFSMSAFTDNTAREKGNDFVTYFTAGTSIGVKKGNPKKIASQADLCGLRVAAEKGTIQATALTATKAEGAITLKGQCLKDGKKAPTPVLLPDQAGVNSALVAGRADAFTGDTPVVAYQGKLEGGQIQLAGKTTDSAPYGIAFKKGSPLASVFQKALTQLIANGTYTKIINTWGLTSGAVTSTKINGATS
ncbi:ABC transporter substrate-binding protein [uncultured Jatrophihabitans sp.]|uniref:ABC transporter substrate-binding protein n=1 Tax=uncultured Jatrophihabitans sp. TaxID=1610747 RepID=UPI0035C9B292